MQEGDIINSTTEHKHISFVLLPHIWIAHQDVIFEYLFYLVDNILLQTGTVDGLNGEESTRDFHDFGAEVVAEECGIQRGASYYNFEIFPLLLQLFHQS
jgi:hypothetical protein